MVHFIEVMAMVGMAPPDNGEGGFMGSFWFPLIMIAFLFYFILYLPEKRRKQQREAQLQNLQRGDDIITAGGIYGKITALTDKTVTVEVAPNIRVKVGRQHVSPVAGAAAESAGGKARESEPESKDKAKDKAADKAPGETEKKKSFWSRMRGEM